MGTARFLVTEELIRELMEMPAETRIRNISIGKMVPGDPESVSVFRFEVEDPDIPDGIHDTVPIIFQAVRVWDWDIKEEDVSAQIPGQEV